MKKNEIDDFLRFLVQTLPCKGYLEPLLTVLGKNLGWTIDKQRRFTTSDGPMFILIDPE